MYRLIRKHKLVVYNIINYTPIAQTTKKKKKYPLINLHFTLNLIDQFIVSYSPKTL